MRLETSDGLRLPGLPDGINRLTHSYSDREMVQIFIQCDQESRSDSGSQIVQDPVVISKDNYRSVSISRSCLQW